MKNLSGFDDGSGSALTVKVEDKKSGAVGSWSTKNT